MSPESRRAVRWIGLGILILLLAGLLACIGR